MLSSLNNKFPVCSRRRESGDALDALAKDEGGAVVLLCLAAVLILFLMAWLMFDGIIVTKDKIEVQASADMGAFSQGSVKARSMNMVAFTNVGKRSVVGVHSVYASMFFSYRQYVTDRIMECVNQLPQCDWDVALENAELFLTELDNDFAAYTANSEYYTADVRALHNYQNYITAITRWWGWSEAVTRAQRNGATFATSYPPPRTTQAPGPDLLGQVISEAGPGVGYNQSSMTDQLPVRPGRFDAMIEGMANNQLWREHEHMAVNVDRHRSRSSLGAASDEVIDRGASFDGTMTEGLRYSRMAMSGEGGVSYAAPYVFDPRSIRSEADWLDWTSNIVITFRHEPEYFDHMRDRYRVPGMDYELDTESMTGRMYRPSGFWGMARSEISFQGSGAPDVWTPAWTSRMRPVSLPGEFREQGSDLNTVFHSSLDRLMLSGIFHDNFVGSGAEMLDDLIYMERVTRGMGQTTIEGVSR